ncbi:transmembrane amino acid transporter protein-domain-containing protein [Schizophyllum amplum]|uniref:Transmembrane amino acid transporter protein-domain-containing protein n=1 Tax=Schizophyllum amplum TaxID=97359 RepID=A0A550CLW1_9AGAR|nr:transmembrane amino acid transporter protein-domain-containing protein [Auriculariopsis ampla]
MPAFQIAAHSISRLGPASRRDYEDDDDDEDDEDDLETPRPKSRGDDMVDQFDWDGIPHDRRPTPPPQLTVPVHYTDPASSRLHHLPTPSSPQTRETSPLLHKTLSFEDRHHSRHTQIPPPIDTRTHRAPHPPLERRTSTASIKSFKHVGHSTFGQTLFNSIAILLGIGMLSEPLAFHYAGWIGGTLLNVLYGAITCYTAKILAKIILSDPRLRSYSDIGRKAFGPRATLMISILFCLELFSVAVILVTLYADSLHSIIPEMSANTYKLWGLLILIPTVFLPLSLLSYTSILGIVSTKEAPGSLVAFGLFMAGFSGHAVIPSLVRDMQDPTEYEKMLNYAFIAATAIYTTIGYAGYLMFGANVSEEISLDLLRTPGYNKLFNQLALWSLVISPLSKFALTTQPLNATIEMLIGLTPHIGSPEDVANKPRTLSGALPHLRTRHFTRVKNYLSARKLTAKSILSRPATRHVFAVTQRVVVTCLAVLVSIIVPEFSAMMAFLGAFSAFMLCVIGPIAARLALEAQDGKQAAQEGKRWGVRSAIDIGLVLMALAMAGWGRRRRFWRVMLEWVWGMDGLKDGIKMRDGQSERMDG